MLPSTGYFKGINCPFYDTGLCERPYCHFRHSKKESLPESNGEGIDNGEILQQLVSEAVKKVLLHADSGQTADDSPVPSKSIISKVVQELNPNATTKSVNATKVTYNPTPIAELNKLVPSELESASQVSSAKQVQNKKHIPVPYTPHRPARLHSVTPHLSIKSVTNKHESIGTAGAVPTEQNKYTPLGGCPNSNTTYLPGSVTYNAPLPYSPSAGASAKDTANSKSTNYVPTDIGNISSVSQVSYVPPGQSASGVSYSPGTVNYSTSSYCPKNTSYSAIKPTTDTLLSYSSTLHYKPTPLQRPQFSSDEDEEPVVKKAKFNDDFQELEDLEPEFELLGQILDDENDITSKIVSDPFNIAKAKETVNINNDKSISKSADDKHKKKTSQSKLNHTSHSTSKSNSVPSDKLKTSKSNHEHNKSRQKSDHNKTDSTSKHNSKDSNKHRSSKDKDKHRSSDKSKSGSSSSTSTSSKISGKSSRSTSKSQSTSKSTDSKSKHHSSGKTESNQSKSRSSDSSTKSEKKGHRSHSEKSSAKKEVAKLKEKNLKEVQAMSDGSPTENELIEEFSDSDEDTIAQECLRIFEEYVPSIKETVNAQKIIKKDNSAEDSSQGNSKKRVAHSTNQTIYRSATKILPDHKTKAVMMMTERLSKVKEYHKSRSNSSSSIDLSQYQNNLPPKDQNEESSSKVKNEPSRSANTGSKVRIAHVPNVSTLLTAKKALPKAPEPQKSTPTQTVSKGVSRVAHVPNDVFSERPGVLEPLASKIPANIRSRYLNLMIDECLKIYLTAEDAYTRGQEEELTTNKKCTSIPIYKNSAVLTISRLRKELQEAKGVKRGNALSHGKVLAGKIGDKVSWSIENKYKNESDFTNEFKGSKFYENISRWVLSEQELLDNGFPRVHPEIKEKGIAKIFTKNTRQKPQKGDRRTCCRCKKEYVVNKKGVAVSSEECIYHPNNKYRFRGEVKYQCCSQDASSDGCLSATCHVHEYLDHDKLCGFVNTLPKDDSNDSNHQVYALDCEMCYTTSGLDLTRVTVIDPSCKVVFESLVKPLNPIIDYNTRYSGLTEEDMQGVTTTLLEIQATFLHMFSNKTILVGHSLESDFKALKLIHDTVVDTSVIFPHKMGPPYKRALRNLTSEYLRKIIQNSVDGGHDSAEDATVCMELLIWKLKEELKVR